MKLIKIAITSLVASTSFMCASVVHAKDVTGVMLVTPTVPLNSNAALQINFTHTDSSLCGVAIDWGNGNQQEIRLGYEKFKDSPVTLNQTYASPGTYFIKLRAGTYPEACFLQYPVTFWPNQCQSG